MASRIDHSLDCKVGGVERRIHALHPLGEEGEEALGEHHIGALSMAMRGKVGRCAAGVSSAGCSSGSTNSGSRRTTRQRCPRCRHQRARRLASHRVNINSPTAQSSKCLRSTAKPRVKALRLQRGRPEGPGAAPGDTSSLQDFNSLGGINSLGCIKPLGGINSLGCTSPRSQPSKC